MSITLGHLAIRDTDEKHSLFTLPQSLPNFHLACAGPSKTALKTEPCIQPLSYPIYCTLSVWNNFHQTTWPSFSLCRGSCQSCLVLSLQAYYHLLFTTFVSVPSSFRRYWYNNVHWLCNIVIEYTILLYYYILLINYIYFSSHLESFPWLSLLMFKRFIYLNNSFFPICILCVS